MKQTIWAALVLFALVGTAHAASFDCVKAMTKVEKAICQNEELSRADSELDNTFKEVRDRYDAGKRKNFISGQRNWLKLRGLACISQDYPNEGLALAECLLSVYKERQGELKELLEIQNVYKGKNASALGDIESVLDQKLELGNAPESLNAMRPHGNFKENGEEEKEEHIPKTCRELFTLSSGIWEFGSDNIGATVSQGAFNACAERIYVAQNYSPTFASKPIVDFNDIKQYSVEFKYVNAVHNQEIDEADVMSFDKAAISGRMKLSNDMHSAFSNCSKGLDDSTLYIEGKKEYLIECMHHSFTISPVGDYTGQGRQEVIMSIGSYPTMGSMKLSTVLVAYYDPETKSIRPDVISQKTRLRLLTEDQAEP